MLALWIVLAVVVATLVVGLVVAVPRRSRARRAARSPGAAAATIDQAPHGAAPRPSLRRTCTRRRGP